MGFSRRIAQLVEHQTVNLTVEGSTPSPKRPETATDFGSVYLKLVLRNELEQHLKAGRRLRSISCRR